MAKDKICTPFLALASPENKFTVSTIDDLKSRNYLTVGDIVDLNGYYTAGDGAGHKRKIEATDDGSGVQLVNGLWANVVKGFKDVNLINTVDVLRKLRNNRHDISFTLMGDSIWWQLDNGSAPPYLNNGTSRIYTEMIKMLNDYIFKGKLSVVENLTFPGDDASRAFTRYERQNFKGDIVMICYGANDTKFTTETGEGGTCFPVTEIKMTFDRHKKYMEKIIEKTILEGKVPIVLGCTAPRSYVQSYHNEVDPNRQNMVLMADLDKEIADKYGALYICVYDYMKNYTDNIFPGEDSVHPTNILQYLGKRIASNFIGLITNNSKFKTEVKGELNLGVRKTFDNFMTSLDNPIIRKNNAQCWSNSGEYLELTEGETICYSFYNEEDCIFYPQVIQEYGSKVKVGINFGTYENSESKTFKDSNYAMYRRIDFENENTVQGRVLCLTSPKTYLSAKQIVGTGFRGIVAPLKIIPKGFNTIYIQSTKGSCKVLGVSIQRVCSNKNVFDSSSFNSITNFNDFIQEGEFNFYKNTMPNLTLNLPPNYNEQPESFFRVTTTYDGNRVDPFFVSQEFYTRHSVCIRSMCTSYGWSKWFEIKTDKALPIWSDVSDFNNLEMFGSFYGSTSNANYNNMVNKPNIDGHIIFTHTDIPNVGSSLVGCSSLGGIAIRFKTSGSWGAWAYLGRQTPTKVEDLNTPYHTLKMQQEGVYEDFITYMDDKTEYDRLQREQPKGVMMLSVIEEPQPSEALLKFKEKYLG